MNSLTDEAIISVATFLLPVELAKLARSSQRFGARASASLVEEVARRRVEAGAKSLDASEEGQRAFLRRGEDEPWTAVAQRLHQLRTALFFDKLCGGSVDYANMNPAHVQATSDPRGLLEDRGSFHEFGDDYYYCEQAVYSLAICHEVMTKGKHYVEFVVTEGGYFDCGILRPCKGWDTEGVPASEKLIFASYSKFITNQGGEWGAGNRCYFGFSGPQGKLCDANTTIAMLFDYDEGTLTGYKDSVINFKRNSLSGPFCFAVGIISSPSGGAVKVRRAPIPDEGSTFAETKKPRLL